ncbi:MAG: DUF2892 domain-containing protein [Bacteroidetes bacterium]|nr:MAG: DUF2892 domain-containing protein [Bacteroidota bacterium]
MKKNMSTVDRIVRVIIALIVAVLYYMQIIDGTVAIVLLALSAIFVLTSLLSFCPIYAALGISTASKE